MSRRQTAQSAETRKTTPPITAHRLFPALVAIWFAALFGLGSFALPASLIERVIVMIGLPAAMPAAAPPLGITARLLIALALTVAGIVLGLLLALRLRARPDEAVRRRKPAPTAVQVGDEQVAAAQPVSALAARLQVRAIDSHPDAPPRRPFSLSEDLVGDAEGIAPADHVGDGVDADLSPADLSGPDLSGPDLSGVAMQDAETSGTGPFAGEIFEAEPFEAEPFEAEISGNGDAHSGVALLDAPVVDAPVVDAPVFDAPLADDLSSSPMAFETGIEDGEWSVAPLDVPALTEAIAPPPAANAAPVAAAAISPVTAFRAGTRAGTALNSAPLDQLGLVQLIERLALAIDSRMSARLVAPAAPAPQQPAPVAAPAPVMPVEAAIIQPAPVDEPVPAEAPPVAAPIAPPVERQVFIVPSPAISEPVEDIAEPSSAPATSAPAMPRFPSAAAPAPAVSSSAAPRILSARWDEADHAEDDEIVVPRFLGPAGSDSGSGSGSGSASGASPAAVVQPVTDRATSLESANSAPRETPRQEFVRVDLPVAPVPPAQPGDAGVAEPVVVFPGQGPRAAASIDLVSGAAGRPMPGNAPGNVPQAGQVFATGVPAQGPEEADRALRAALATLQRMTARG